MEKEKNQRRYYRAYHRKYYFIVQQLCRRYDIRKNTRYFRSAYINCGYYPCIFRLQKEK